MMSALKILAVWGFAVLGSGLIVYWSGADRHVDPDESSAAPSPSGIDRAVLNGIIVESGDHSPVTIRIDGGAVPHPSGDTSPAPAVSATADSAPDYGAVSAPEPVPPQSLLDELASPVRDLAAELIEREGYRQEPYTLAGHRHVCYGHRLADGQSGRPRTAQECISLLVSDLAWAFESALAFAGPEGWNAMGPRRQGVIVELAYLLGHAGLMEFDRMQRAVRSGDWEAAVRELRDSGLPRDPDRGGIGREAVEKLAMRLR